MKTLVATVVCALAGSPLWAAPRGTITLETDNSTRLYATASISPESIADLNGIEVIFGFSNGSSAIGTFNSDGQATATNNTATITAPTDKTDGTWSVENTGSGFGLASISFFQDASTSATGFYADANCNGGSDLCIGDATASYSEPVAIDGVMPATPGYYDLTITFDVGVGLGYSFDFDMGSEYFPGPITSTPAASGTPEPASFFMILAALATFGTARFHLRHKRIKGITIP